MAVEEVEILEICWRRDLSNWLTIEN